MGILKIPGQQFEMVQHAALTNDDFLKFEMYA
jgi:hypothetical protein